MKRTLHHGVCTAWHAPALVAMALLASGCNKAATKDSEDPKLVTSCLIHGTQGERRQCFEFHDDAVTRERRPQECKEKEGETKFLEGPCPIEGSVGLCTQKVGLGQLIERRYVNAEQFKKSCVEGGGTFSTP